MIVSQFLKKCLLLIFSKDSAILNLRKSSLSLFFSLCSLSSSLWGRASRDQAGGGGAGPRAGQYAHSLGLQRAPGEAAAALLLAPSTPAMPMCNGCDVNAWLRRGRCVAVVR